jgi:hypothetical protein
MKNIARQPARCNTPGKQNPKSQAAGLAARDRRLFLSASLSVLMRKLRHGDPIRSEEITQLAEYAE